MPHLGDRAPITCPDTPLMLIGRDPGPNGSYGRSAPDAQLPRDPNDLPLWLPGQGQANACGTVTLAYVLRYLLGDRAPSRGDIDEQLRRGNIFSAPLLLASYARRLGLATRMYNGASLELVFELIDRGVPVMVLADTTPLNLRDTANLHWVALVAHCEGRVGIYNPHGYQEELDVSSFEAHWKQARIFGLPAWHNLAIAIARHPAELPQARRPDLSAIGAHLSASGVAGVANAALGVYRGFDMRSLRVDARLRLDAVGVLIGAAQTLVGSAILLTGATVGAVVGWIQRRSSRTSSLPQNHSRR